MPTCGSRRVKIEVKQPDSSASTSLHRAGLRLKLQSVTRDSLSGQTMVRVQLTDGRGSDAALENHGYLLSGRRHVADYHSPLLLEGHRRCGRSSTCADGAGQSGQALDLIIADALLPAGWATL
jgi:hypothetical protein